MLVSPNVDSSLRITPILAAGELSASISKAMRGGLSIMSFPSQGSGGEPPRQRLAGAKGLQLGVAERQRLGQGPGELLQGHRRVVQRQTVEGSAGPARELLEPVERAGGLERLGVKLERAEGGVAAGAAVGVLLQRRRMRGAVGAEKEAVAARGRRGDERAPVLFALQDRKAVEVRPQATAEQRVAVVEKMVRGDGRGRVGTCFGDVLCALPGGDVLEDDLQRREVAPEAEQVTLDEDRFAIEDVDR